MENAFTKDGKTPLEAPEVFAGETTSSSISFYWSAVDNAGQYSYKVLNPAGYVVAKGETKETSVFVKGLKFGTTFKVYVSAIPEGVSAKTLCASDYTIAEIKTDDPIIIDYEWVLDGQAWFYYDADKWNKCPVTVGLEKGTGHFIITSYCGAECFDFYFDLTAFDGTYPFSFDNSMKNMAPVEGQAIDTQGPIGSRPDFYLAHGLGGKTQDYNIFYGAGASYEYGLIDTTGGYIDFWTTNFDAQWCGYRVEFGEYKAPEPDPWTPDPDMTESWTANGEISIDGAATKTYADIAFDAASGEYTISNWYGAEGYDLVFTRNQEDGTWIINNEKSSAYASSCPGDGLVGYLHGTEGASKLIWIKDGAESGLEGTDAEGNVWISIIDPNGAEVSYSLAWPSKKNEFLQYDWSVVGNVLIGDAETGRTASMSYEAATGTFTVHGWYGVEGHDVVFSLNDSYTWVIDYANSSAYVTGPDGNNAVGLSHGLEDAAKANCWFYTTDGYSGFTGDNVTGTIYAWIYDANGNWTSYTLSWEDYRESWSIPATVYAGDTNFGTATLEFNGNTGAYTLKGWFGVEGYDVIVTGFTDSGDWMIDTENSSAYVSGPDSNGAIGLAHGVADAAKSNCWFYTSAGYSGMDGNKAEGSFWAWIYDPNSNWCCYQLVW